MLVGVVLEVALGVVLGVALGVEVGVALGGVLGVVFGVGLGAHTTHGETIRRMVLPQVPPTRQPPLLI